MVRPRVAVPAVLVIVQLMRSPLAGVTENDVPVPDGNTVGDPPVALEHEMELAYWPSTEVEPAAIASVSVYAVPPVSVVIPVVAETAAPAVVAAATVDAPFLIATVNWSAATARDPTDFSRVRCGLAVLVMVQVMVSPLAGVIEKEIPAPLGNTVLEAPLVFVQEIELVYAPMAETEPPAMASERVYAVPAASKVDPVVAETATPDVLTVASVVAPCAIATVNWSAAFTRPTTDFNNVRCGFAVLVMVQEMTSLFAGVIEKLVPAPLGSTVGDPAALLVQLIEAL